MIGESGATGALVYQWHHCWRSRAQPMGDEPRLGHDAGAGAGPRPHRSRVALLRPNRSRATLLHTRAAAGLHPAGAAAPAGPTAPTCLRPHRPPRPTSHPATAPRTPRTGCEDSPAACAVDPGGVRRHPAPCTVGRSQPQSAGSGARRSLVRARPHPVGADLDPARPGLIGAIRTPPPCPAHPARHATISARATTTHRNPKRQLHPTRATSQTAHAPRRVHRPCEATADPARTLVTPPHVPHVPDCFPL